MPVQDHSDKPTGWSTKVLVGAVAVAMAVVWFVAAAVGGGNSSGVRENAMWSIEMEGMQGVWNSTLGVSFVFSFVKVFTFSSDSSSSLCLF